MHSISCQKLQNSCLKEKFSILHFAYARFNTRNMYFIKYSVAVSTSTYNLVRRSKDTMKCKRLRLQECSIGCIPESVFPEMDTPITEKSVL